MKQDFLDRMKEMLKDEYEQYLNTLDQPAYRGLRVNTLKISAEAFQNLQLFDLKPTPFAEESFYIDSSLNGVGNHPSHLSGMIYLQEPSAASAVSVLDPQENDWVLDLCAAPGGKSTQIAARLNNTGFLLSNEIENSRANILLSNMERCGVSEMMVSNASPAALCEQVKGWFDKVLVDAPCSGEGMFKKNAKALEDWSIEHVKACQSRQLHILDSAYQALKQEGVLVYSTCTYAPEENELVIQKFLAAHKDMELVDCKVKFGRAGLSGFGIDENNVRRIFPMDQGEGHFIAKMIKHGEQQLSPIKEIKASKLNESVQDFMNKQGCAPLSFYEQQGKVYGRLAPFIKLDKIRILRQGIECGEIIKNRFEPHHAFYLASVNQPYFKQSYELKPDEIKTYLHGDIINAELKGYTAILYQGVGIGFAKGDGRILKNKFPKGLRVNSF